MHCPLDPQAKLPSLACWHDDTPHSAALNMALDEALLRSRPEHVVLRFYRWSEPAVSIGYFQEHQPVRAGLPKDVALVRRSTGGGLVDHRVDATYSLILPSCQPWSKQCPNWVYQQVHGMLALAMESLGVHAELAREALPESPGACFAGGHALHDVLVESRKVAGAAQRRTRFGLLHQGSVLREGLPVEVDALWERFSETVAENSEAFALDPGLEEAAEALAAEKYGAAEWLSMR